MNTQVPVDKMSNTTDLLSPAPMNPQGALPKKWTPQWWHDPRVPEFEKRQDIYMIPDDLAKKMFPDDQSKRDYAKNLLQQQMLEWLGMDDAKWQKKNDQPTDEEYARRGNKKDFLKRLEQQIESMHGDSNVGLGAEDQLRKLLQKYFEMKPTKESEA